MSCEFCPADADSCSVCRDDVPPDPLTPRFLYDYGCGCGFTGDTLARTVATIQDERGVLNLAQIEDLIQGWEAGTLDADNFRKDMAANPYPDGLTPEDRANIPF